MVSNERIAVLSTDILPNLHFLFTNLQLNQTDKNYILGARKGLRKRTFWRSRSCRKRIEKRGKLTDWQLKTLWNCLKFQVSVLSPSEKEWIIEGWNSVNCERIREALHGKVSQEEGEKVVVNILEKAYGVKKMDRRCAENEEVNDSDQGDIMMGVIRWRGLTWLLEDVCWICRKKRECQRKWGSLGACFEFLQSH